MHDNRNYIFSGREDSMRPEYPWIIDQIQDNSSVIDLGCGDGSLLSRLKKKKNIQERGIEISISGVETCRKKDLKVEVGRIDEPLTKILSKSFDFSVCNVTIQMVSYPEVLLSEMARISKYQIVSFPNFGFIKNRFELMFKGRMPKTTLFGYTWYNTGHIHQLSVRDFEKYCRENNFKVIKKCFLYGVPGNRVIDKFFGNLLSMVAIYKLEHKE